MRVMTTHSVAHPPKGSAHARIPVIYGDPWVVKPCEFLPPERFCGPGETTAERRALRTQYGLPESATGANSDAVKWRLFSCTAGWPDPPDAGDLYTALRAEAPSPRQQAVIRTWLREATEGEIIRAWLEEAYSWRELVEAAQRVGYCRNELARLINRFAKPQEDCEGQPA